MLVTVPRMVMVTLPQVSLALGASKDQALAHSTVLLATQVMTGGGGSFRATFSLPSAGVAQGSVARQGRRASRALPPWPGMLVTVPRMVMVTLPQVSLALGASKDQALAHSTVLLATQVMTGGV